MKIASLIFAIVALTAACGKTATNKPAAKPVYTPTPDTRPPLDFPIVGTAVTFGPATSTIEFLASEVTGESEAGFNLFRGVIDLVDEKPEMSRLMLEIETATITTDVPDVTERLKTAGFFDVAKYPKAIFVTQSIVPDTAKGAVNYTVTGELELRGVKRSITFPATITITPDRVAIKSDFLLDRGQYGIGTSGKAGSAKDEVAAKIDIVAPRNK